jgi:hypothetical protein
VGVLGQHQKVLQGVKKQKSNVNLFFRKKGPFLSCRPADRAASSFDILGLWDVVIQQTVRIDRDCVPDFERTIAGLGPVERGRGGANLFEFNDGL